MSSPTSTRWSRPALVLGGMLWIAVRFLVAFDPPPLTYDDYNRLFTLPLLLVLVGWLGILPHLGSTTGLVRGGWAVALAGMSIMLIGNMVEFWSVLFQDKLNAQAAVGSGEEAWVGSDIGWMTFGLGHLLVVVGMAIVGVVVMQTRLLGRWSALPVIIAVLGLLWPILSFTPFGDFAVMAATGAAWALLGLHLPHAHRNTFRESPRTSVTADCGE